MSKRSGWWFGWWLFLSLFAHATSVAPREFKCPVCGKGSIHNELMSYSDFGGPPARDRMFEPVFADVRICPHDLHAAWGHRWEKLAEGDKERLAELLKQPAVALTDEEKKIIGPHLAELRKSRRWEILWARTCDQARKPDADNARFTALQLYFQGQFDNGEPWIRELSKHYRDQAVLALEGSHKPQHRFLRAELLRQIGRNGEAAAIFRKLADESTKKPKAKEDEDEAEEREGFKLLCEEGLLLIEAEGLSAERIAGWLIQPLRPPADEKPPAGWSRHRIGVQSLVTRAIAGDKEAGDILWKQLAKHPERLEALDETLESTPGAPRARELRQCGEPWVSWFDKVDGFGPPSPDYMDDSWQKNTLLPLVIAADAGGKIPASGFPRDDLAFALASLADQEIGRKEPVLKTIIRLLQELPEPKEKPAYGFLYATKALAEHSGKAPSPIEADGRWKSEWWKLVVDYATGKPGTGPALANDPLASKSFKDDGKAFEFLLWELFALKKDPIWKAKVIATLQSPAWLHDEPVEYAFSLDDAEVNAALEKALARPEAGKKDVELWFTATYVIGNCQREMRMAALPVR